MQKKSKKLYFIIFFTNEKRCLLGQILIEAAEYHIKIHYVDILKWR